MDSLEVNKACAAVLVAGITFMLSAIVGDALVHPHRLAQPAIKIEGAEAAAAGAPAGGGKEAPPQPIGPLLASADVGAGEAYAKKVCAACHSFTEGGKAGVGPNLYGVVGAPHGHMEGFNYSDAIKGKKGPWTYDELNEWLTKPAAYAPGTRMAFAGIGSEKTRADVIDYLHTLAHNPEPLPAAAPAATPAAAQSGNSEHGQGGAPAAAAKQQSASEKAAGATAAPAPQAGAPAK